MKEENNGLNIVCPFCNKKLPPNIVLGVEEDFGGCDTCGPESADVVIEINCPKCKKLIYKKEGKSYDF